MTKRIFRSIMLVSALVLVIGLGFIMGILYHYFGSQIEKELKSETAVSYTHLTLPTNSLV